LSADEAARQLDRLVDRLRSLGLARLERPHATAGRSPAQLVLATCTRWAEVVHGPEGPEVPELSAGAAGDQLAVIGGELVAAWRRGQLTHDEVEQVASDLAALRAVT
jgi:hypothetical protein